MAPVSSGPPAGSGSSQTFTFTFSDSAGYQNLGVVDILIQSALDGRHACYLAFVPSGPAAGVIDLVDDAGDAGGPYSFVQLPGSGTAQAGKVVFDSRCVTCHGATAREGPQDVLVGGQGTLASAKPLKTVGSFWPYATSVWNYVNRAMPFNQPGLLSPAEVYAAVAYILFMNGIVREKDVLNAKTLPKIRMPNRDGFVPDPRPDVGRR